MKEKEKFNLIAALQKMKEGEKCVFDYQRDTTEYYFLKNNMLWFKTKSGEEKVSGLSIFKIDVDEWELYEEPKPILDTEEKAYLEAVLRPFKDRVAYIYKCQISGYECISIKIVSKSNLTEYNEIELPYFEKGTMYKNMKDCEDYTLKELGLFDRKIY